jgi:hypothetical protein
MYSKARGIIDAIKRAEIQVAYFFFRHSRIHTLEAWAFHGHN